MTISQKTIEKLRELINEETEYRSGSNSLLFSISMDLEMYMVMASPQDGYIQRKKYVH